MASRTDHTAAVLARVRKKFGEDAAMTLDGGSRSTVKEATPSGIEGFDRYVLGVGGLPVGRMIEVYSEEGSGKTSLLLSSMAAFTQGTGVTLLAETELSLQSDRATVFGVDQAKVIMLDAETTEDVLDQAIYAIESIPAGAGPNFFGWDSIAATNLKSQLYGKAKGKDKVRSEDNRGAGVGEAGRVLSEKIKLLCKVAQQHRTHLFMVNQVRDKIGIMFGPTQGTPGGHAVKFHSSARFQLFRGKGVKVGEQNVGTTITIYATKNKMAMPFRKVRARLDFRYGWDDRWTTIELAKTLKLIPPKAKGAKALALAREKLGWPASALSKADEAKLEEAESLDHGEDPVEELESDLGKIIEDGTEGDDD